MRMAIAATDHGPCLPALPVVSPTPGRPEVYCPDVQSRHDLCDPDVLPDADRCLLHRRVSIADGP